MAILIALDDGHGMETAGKRTPDGYRENAFNKEVVKYAKAELERCGFAVLLVAPTDADTSLTARTNLANSKGAKAYVSVHYNALGSKWRSGEGGIETYHYPNSSTGKKLADALHKYVIQGTSLRNRGVKSANFAVLRQTKMPAALIEAGFMDIKREADLMKSVAYQKETASEIAKGLCEYFGVTYKPEPKPQPKPPANLNDMHRIIVDGKQVGAYRNLENAIDILQSQKTFENASKVVIEKVK